MLSREREIGLASNFVLAYTTESVHATVVMLNVESVHTVHTTVVTATTTLNVESVHTTMGLTKKVSQHLFKTFLDICTLFTKR